MKSESDQIQPIPSIVRGRVYLFLENNKLVLQLDGDGRWETFLNGPDLESLGESTPEGLRSVEIGKQGETLLAFAMLEGSVEDLGDAYRAFTLKEIYELSKTGSALAESLLEDLPVIRENVIRIPYLYFKETDYIYRFRTDKQRNKQIYHIDDSSSALYHSSLCDAIKAVKRAKERSASTPATLDFGAVEYLLPSHFGFCLGVQNAIERAYETIAAHPGRRVFMLSELIHNPFVNEDLKSRGLHYLQSDKGVPAVDSETGKLFWDVLTDDDVVIIPAFGARDEDKVKLIESGLPLNAYDATCMLVEKVWKAAKRYGQRGFTVVIHGKAEHEETKATFSNSAKYAPSLIVRDMKEAVLLAGVIQAEDPDERERLFEPFRDRCSSDFDVSRHFEKLALVNQTTLLRNETLKIIDYLEEVLKKRYGSAHIEEHMAMSSKGDTLCYATQVNQDALAQAIEEPIDIAIVVGGKNSSNTYQLYRICELAFGDRAFYIQSEANIQSKTEIEHFIFPYNRSDPRQGRMEMRPFLPEESRPLRVLITGGASCPDGLLQQIIAKVNNYFDPSKLRRIEDVMTDVENQG